MQLTSSRDCNDSDGIEQAPNAVFIRIEVLVLNNNPRQIHRQPRHVEAAVAMSYRGAAAWLRFD